MESSQSGPMVVASDPHRKQEERFSELIVRADDGKLSFGELQQLARLYRVHTSRLSLERHRSRDPERIAYLNSLCVRAYAHVYAEPPRRSRGSSLLWLKQIPAAQGRCRREILLAAGLLLLGAALGAVLVLQDPAHLSAVVPGAMYPADRLEELYASAEARVSFLERRETAAGANAQFAGMLFANNTRVGWLGLAAGILGAIPTVFLLIYNGLTLGGFATIFLRGDEWGHFVVWILPHAVAELLAIVLCSAAGLRLGFAVMAPGRIGLRPALKLAGADAASLFVASLPLFVAAALIESFVRESQLSSAARLAVAVGSVLFLVAYSLAVRSIARRQAAVDVSFLHARY